MCVTLYNYIDQQYTETFFHQKFILEIYSHRFSHTLCDLAHVCAEVSCNIGVLVNKELMGAFRALCLPMNMMKACMTGFNHLTSKSNVR